MQRLSLGDHGVRLLLPLLVGLLALGCGACRPSPAAPLALQRVVLYRNGMAYLEHEGRVVDGTLRLSLAPGEVDDVLKTLTVVDRGGGKVTVAAEVDRAQKGQARGLNLRFTGQPSGKIQLAYATSAPLWKPSYRLVLPDVDKPGEKALLQGWAMVTNASAQDWTDVRLTLATASPVSYAVDLSTPERVRRPRLASSLSSGLSGLAGLRIGAGAVDTDHDAIPDVDDKCPTEPENQNGVMDDDGCPDRARVVVRSSQLQILDKLYFARGSARLAPATSSILAAIAQTLVANPKLHAVLIEGHADDREGDAWSLSSARAAAVRAALRSRGVKQPLRIVGYGSTRPIDARKTVEARSRNRRVEFRLQRRPAPKGSITAQALARSSSGAPSQALPRSGAVRYELAAPTSIRRGHSALVTMLHAPVEGHEVLLVRADAASESTPLRAAWLQNRQQDGLEAGPVAIFSGGTYVGDGALKRLAPGEQSLLPFAVEHGSRVYIERRHRRVAGTIVGLAAGRLTVQDELIAATDYRLACGRLAPSRAIIVHKLRDGYEARSLPPKTTRSGSSALLLPLPLRPGKITRYTQREARADRRTLVLRYIDPELLVGYLQRSKLPPALSAKLAKVVQLSRERRALAKKLSRLDGAAPRLTRQSAELRRNLEALRKLPESVALRRTLLTQLRGVTDELRRTIVQESAAQLRRAKLEQELERLARGLRYDRKPT